MLKTVFVCYVKLSHTITCSLREGDANANVEFGSEEIFPLDYERATEAEALADGERFAVDLLERGKAEEKWSTEDVMIDWWVARRISRGSNHE